VKARTQPEGGGIVPAGTASAVRLAGGQRITVINTHGTQVVDFWAFRSGRVETHLSMAHTRAVLGRHRPVLGDVLHQSDRLPNLTLVEDTTPGVHDTLIAACDPERYRQLGVTGWHANCRENFWDALTGFDERPKAVPDPLNLFMNIPWDASGALEFQPGVARAGDRVGFLALVDVVVVMSACPQDLVPINGEAMKPRDISFEVRPGAVA
jgi:uncharacterized protein YcgI (DUF1989 family)